jgi:hypothetical protein
MIKSGERGKYAKRYREEGTNLVLIDPDLHELFPDSESVTRRSVTTYSSSSRPAEGADVRTLDARH